MEIRLICFSLRERDHGIPSSCCVLQIVTNSLSGGAEEVRRDAILDEQLRTFQKSLLPGDAIAPAELAAVGQRGAVEVPIDAIRAGDR